MKAAREIREIAALLLLAGIFILAGQWLFSLPGFRGAVASAILGREVTAESNCPLPCEIPMERLFTINYFGMKYFGDTSTLIDREIICKGGWALPELAFLENTAQTIYAENASFIDIGANSGAHSLYMSRHVDVVHAFEPYRPVLERLEKSITESGIDNIVIHPVGLGEESALTAFNSPSADNQGTGSFVEGLFPNNTRTNTELEIVKGDEYFTRMSIDRVDLIKVDTEGYEKPVLRGLAQVISKHRPVILFEFTTKAGFEELFHSWSEIESVFPADYIILELATVNDTGYRLQEPDIRFDSRFFGQTSLVAVPSEISDKLVREGSAHGVPPLPGE